MGFYKIVYQGEDLVQIQFGGRVGIEHGGMVDVFSFVGEGRQLGRQEIDPGGLQAVFIDQAGHFDATAGR